MKKLCIIVTLLCIQNVNVHADQSLEERLGDAINGSRAPLLHQLLRRLDRDSMALAQKKTLVSDLSYLAQEVYENKKTRVSLLGSKKDFLMSSIGSLVGSYGIVNLWYSIADLSANYRRYTWADLLLFRDEALLNRASRIVVPTLLGAYVTYKGLTCSTQKAEMSQSQAIRNSLEQKEEELGL